MREAWTIGWEGIFYALAGDLPPKWHNELDPSVMTILECGTSLALGGWVHL